VQDFPVNHYVYRAIEVEVNSSCRRAVRQGMLDVRAGEQPWKHPEQAEPANGTPADILNLSIGGIGFRRNHHFPAREFAVAKREE
jgi:hypothetical protein